MLIHFNLGFSALSSRFGQLKSFEVETIHRHSGESRNPESFQADNKPGCRIKSGMTQELLTVRYL